MNTAIKLLEKIEAETQGINKNFIFDFLVGNKAEVDRDDFLEKSLREVSEDFRWDEKGLILSDLKKILDDENYSLRISGEEFLTGLAKTIPAEYLVEIKEALEAEKVLEARINRLSTKSVSWIYPYFDNIFFIETSDQYIFFSLGYID